MVKEIDLSARRPIYGPAYPLFLFYILSCFGYSFANLVRKYRKLTGLGRIQMQFLLLGTLIGISGGVITNLIIPALFRTSKFSFYGPFFSIFLFGFVSHAILRYRLMDIKVIVRKWAAYLISSALAVGVVIGILGLYYRMAKHISYTSVSDFSSLYIATLSGVLLFIPLNYLFQLLMRRYLYWDYDYRRILKEINSALVTLDLKKLLEETASRITRGMKIESASVFLREKRDGSLRLQTSVTLFGGEKEMPPLIPSGSALVRELERRINSSDEPFLVREELFKQTGIIDALRIVEEMEMLKSDVAFPLVLEDKLIGLLLLGRKLSGDPYFQPDLDLLLVITDQLAVSAANAMLHMEIRRLEMERQKMERLNITASFASGILHEIKNSLVVIRTFAEMLPEGYSDPDFRENFSKSVLKEVEHIDLLIRHLRDLSVPPKVEFAKLKVETVIEEALSSLKGRIKQAGIRVKRDYDPNLPPIRGNAFYLRQLFFNLMLNAIQAMPDGGEIRIRTEFEHDLSVNAPGFARVDISDTGVGIPEENLDKVLQPFFTTKEEGIGLGLAICRNIVDVHGGTIEIRNNEDKGVTVTVKLPIGDGS